MNKRSSYPHRIPPILLLFAIIGSSLSVLFSPSPAYAAWFNDDWQFRREITVDNTGNTAKTDYPVKVDLTSANFSFANAEADGTDIRFTDSDGETLLDFWRESYDTGAETATFWVKVPSIPADSTATIYIYYGNAGAASTSSIDDTFLFGENFRETATAIANLSGDVSEADGIFIANYDGFPDGEIAVAGGTGWRQSQVREQSNIVKVGATFYILVSGRDSSGNVDVGQYSATNIEGPWTEFASNPVIDLAEDPYIVVEEDGTPYNDGTYYYVYFERKIAGNASSQADIGVARTTDFENFEVWDGATWTATTANHASVLDRGAASSWDETFTASPTVVHDGTNFNIMYEGRGGASVDAIGVARGSSPEGAFTKEATNPISALEVVDDLRRVGTAWWLVGHVTSGNLQRFTSATNGPAAWDNTSFVQDGWDPFEVSGGISLMLAFDGTTAYDGYATWQRDTSALHVALLVGGSKWRPVNFPDDKDYTQTNNREQDREIIIDETDKHLTLQPAEASSRRMSFGLMSQDAVLPGVDFAIHAMRRTRVNPSADQNRFTGIAWGTGEPDVDVTKAVEHFPYIHTGVLAIVFDPGSNGVLLREYSAAEVVVGNIDTDAGNVITDAVVEAFNEHILSYIDSGVNGTVSYVVDGTEYASGSPTNDLTAGAKNLLIGQGQNENDDGGISDWQYLFARSWDGEDPAQTVGSEEIVPASTGGSRRSSPTISSISAKEITSTSAMVTWHTSAPTETRLVGEGAPEPDPTPKTKHEVSVTNLSPDTLYHYTIHAKKPGSSAGTTASLGLKTLAHEESQTIQPSAGGAGEESGGSAANTLEELRQQIRELQLRLIPLLEQLATLLQERIQAASTSTTK